MWNFSLEIFLPNRSRTEPKQAGLFVTARVGTGLVVARKRGGGWSAPSALGSFGLGWGFQVGGEVSESVILL